VKTEEKKADEASALTVELIADAKKVVAAFEADYTRERAPYIEAAQELKTTINDIEQTLIDEWDGKKKTLKYPVGTLSFRQAGSLRITDDVRLMELLIEKAPIVDVVSKYIKGFKLTDVKKFVEVHNVPTGVASMEYKTTVGLKTELSG
jgi:phage host-nuclease inhibitor protein Gam